MIFAKKMIRNCVLGIVVLATSACSAVAVSQSKSVALTGGDNMRKFIENHLQKIVTIRSNSGVGTGVLFKLESGQIGYHVVTNAHVTEEDDAVLVEMHNGCRVEGVPVLGRDYVSDLAVLSLDANQYCNKSYKYFELSPKNRSHASVGKVVFAFGAPLSLSNTVTKGIVSAVNRYRNNYATYVQTDVTINKGNSGGPLISDEGNFWGINTFSLSGYEGLNFAIDAKTVYRIVPALIKNGRRFERANIGITFNDRCLDWIKNEEGMRKSSGQNCVYPRVKSIDTILEDKDKGSCDLKTGDFVKEIDGRTVRSAAEARIATNTIPVRNKPINFVRCRPEADGSKKYNCKEVMCSIRVPALEEKEENWQKRFWTAKGEDILSYLRSLVRARKWDDYPCLGGLVFRSARGRNCKKSSDKEVCGVVLKNISEKEECLLLRKSSKQKKLMPSRVIVIDSVSVHMYDPEYASLIKNLEVEYDYMKPIYSRTKINALDLDLFHVILKKSVEKAKKEIQKRSDEKPSLIVFPTYKLGGQEIQKDGTRLPVEIELISKNLSKTRKSLRNWYGH